MWVTANMFRAARPSSVRRVLSKADNELTRPHIMAVGSRKARQPRQNCYCSVTDISVGMRGGSTPSSM